MSAKLNEKTEKTEKVIHLLVTSLCGRDCKYCCNKQYSLDDVPYVTDEELKNAKVLCLTGGEPFLYTNPCEIAYHYKEKYPNIERVYVYTNAFELDCWLQEHKFGLYAIDGLNISIKTRDDKTTFKHFLKNREDIILLHSNLLYVFNHLIEEEEIPGFKIVQREWQENFVPADDSIFRKV